MHEVGRDDGDATGLRRRAEHLFDPGVVAGAVVEDDLRGRDLADDRRRNLEQVRVLVRVVQDADDCHPVAADLPDNVSVEILSRDDFDLALGGLRGADHCQQGD
jgi:hypothetical protein